MSLLTDDNLGAQADDVYASLLDAMQNMTPEQSQRFNVRLILLLVNHVGDQTVINEAINLAQAGITKS